MPKHEVSSIASFHLRVTVAAVRLYLHFRHSPFVAPSVGIKSLCYCVDSFRYEDGPKSVFVHVTTWTRLLRWEEVDVW